MLEAIRGSLQWKLVLMISAILVVVVTSIGSFSYIRSSDAINGDVERFSMQVMKQANIHLARYINDSENLFKTLASSQELRSWADADNKYKQFYHYRSMESRFIEPFVTYHKETLAVVLYNANGMQSIYRSDQIKDLYLNTHYSLRNEEFVKSGAEIRGFQRVVLLSDDYTDEWGHLRKTPILRYYNKQLMEGQTVYLVIDLSLQYIQDILNQIQLGDNSYAMIADDNRIVSSPDPELVHMEIDSAIYQHIRKDASGSHYIAESKEMLVYSQIPGMDWKVLVMVPYEDLAKSISQVRNWTVFMTVAGLLVAIALVTLVAKSITRRLKELRRTIKKTRMGKFDVRVEVKGTDEVAELGSAYNHLLDRIDNSVAEVAETRIVQQKAVMSALQSQIHSHFFYNALESINSMAHLAGHKEIRRTTVALSSMLRYTSDYQDAVVTVEQEVKHLQDYLSIMQNVYRDALEYRIDVDSDIAGAECLKAVLQPFAENSIKHGYEKTGQTIAIAVHAYRTDEGRIRIDLEDNGPGLEEDKLSELQAALSREQPDRTFNQLSRVGILNVCYRLKTFYPGGTASLEMSRSHRGGLRVSMTFPFHRKEERQ